MTRFHSSQDILRELRRQRDINPNQHIEVPIETTRTVLLIGPTRAGKSTIVNTLRDSLYEPQKSNLFSGTREPESQQVGGLRLIDMPGFNDLQMQTRASSLSNNSILTMLKNQLNANDPVDLVAFVFSLSGGIKQEDINAMLLVQSNLPDLAKRTMLVLTHAEELNNDEKNRLVDEFFNHPDVKRHNLQKFFQQGILFIGCLRYESLIQMDYTALVNEHENVLAMRKQFIEKCFEEVPLSNNPPFTNSITSSRSKRYKLFVILTICVLLGIFVQFGGGKDYISKIFNSAANAPSDAVNDSTTQPDTKLNNRSENQKGIDENIGSSTNLDNSQDQTDTSHVKIDQDSDDTVDERRRNTVSGIALDDSSTQCESSSDMKKILNMFHKMDQRMEKMEHALKELLDERDHRMEKKTWIKKIDCDEKRR
jgi:GTP-binding protein EngB required for normal cell division